MKKEAEGESVNDLSLKKDSSLLQRLSCLSLKLLVTDIMPKKSKCTLLQKYKRFLNCIWCFIPFHQKAKASI